jgi:hypothetical protein
VHERKRLALTGTAAVKVRSPTRMRVASDRVWFSTEQAQPRQQLHAGVTHGARQQLPPGIGQSGPGQPGASGACGKAHSPSTNRKRKAVSRAIAGVGRPLRRLPPRSRCVSALSSPMLSGTCRGRSPG